MTQKEKATAYDEAVKRAKKEKEKSRNLGLLEFIEDTFPELRDSEDEKARKELISFLQLPHPQFVGERKQEKWIDWLEKQVPIDEEKVLIGARKDVALSIMNFLNRNTLGMDLSSMECADLESAVIDSDWSKVYDYMKKKLENQGEQKETLKKVPIWKHWKDGIAGNGEGKPIYLVKIGNTHSLKSCLGFECDYIELSELDNLMFEKQNEQIPTDNPGPKFHEGDWTVSNLDGMVRRISEVHFDGYNSYYVINGKSVNFKEYDILHHRWSIEDVKPGDILSNGKMIVIFKKFEEPLYKQHIIAYIGLDNFGRIQITNEHWELGIDKAKPATKEKCDLLFQKMKEYGYTWNSEKKELLKIEEELTDFEKSLKHVMIETLECGDTRNLKADAEMLLRLAQKHTEWSEEDEKMLNSIIENFGDGKTSNMLQEYWLKSLKPQKQWKPSKEQMEALKASYLYWKGITKEIPYAEKLESLYEQLKKLTE